MAKIAVIGGTWCRKHAHADKMLISTIRELCDCGDHTIAVLNAEGNTVRDSAVNALDHYNLWLPENRATILMAYSAGAQIARQMIALAPRGTFKGLILLSGLSNHGLTVTGFLRALLVIPWPFVRSLFTGGLRIDRPQQVANLFLTQPQYEEFGSLPEGTINSYATKILNLLHEDNLRFALQVATPGFRKRLPGAAELGVPTLAVVPDEDLFAMDADYAEDNAEVISPHGDHSLYSFPSRELTRVITEINAWIRRIEDR